MRTRSIAQAMSAGMVCHHSIPIAARIIAPSIAAQASAQPGPPGVWSTQVREHRSATVWIHHAAGAAGTRSQAARPTGIPRSKAALPTRQATSASTISGATAHPTARLAGTAAGETMPVIMTIAGWVATSATKETARARRSIPSTTRGSRAQRRWVNRPQTRMSQRPIRGPAVTIATVASTESSRPYSTAMPGRISTRARTAPPRAASESLHRELNTATAPTSPINPARRMLGSGPTTIVKATRVPMTMIHLPRRDTPHAVAAMVTALMSTATCSPETAVRWESPLTM